MPNFATHFLIAFAECTLMLALHWIWYDDGDTDWGQAWLAVLGVSLLIAVWQM